MDNITLTPGLNTIELKTKATRTGLWKFGQVKNIKSMYAFMQ